MTIIVFLVDTSASMLQRTYLGISYLDYARLAIEQFLKQRQRDPASNGDRYMLMTFEEYPQNIKSGWKENQRIFNEQLKNLKARGSLNFESGLESVLRLLMVSRMQSGSGAGIETYGFGRYPSYAEHVVVIPVIDGSSLPPASSEAKVPKPRLLPGSELSTEGYRWDQRMYPIVLRLPGHQQPLQQRGNAPQEDQSIAQNFAENMGGRSFAIFSHRSLGPSIDQIIQRIQTNGVLIHFAKHGPDPPPTTETANNQSSREDEPDAWKNSLVLLKGKIGQQHSHWPIPEAYWPDSVKNALPSRSAHPTVAFKCESVAPMFNTEFPLDKYELDSSSPLAQYILNRKESNLCWQVFVENSFRQPGLGFPFGYIKISTSSTVTLYIMPYNYPELLSLLDMTKEFKHVNNAQFPQKFERYLTTVPAYYYSGLKKALSRLKAVPSTLEEANVKLYPYCNLGALWTRIKHQGQQEFETACTTVIRNLQETPTLQLPNPALLVKISRSRHQLGKGPLTDCAFRPAVAPFKANIPADTFKDANIFLLETPPQATAPSLQFKNPFDIARANLCSQLEKMRFNFDQQVQASNLHVLEGGLPGQKIKLQHAEDLHSLPICKMGIYEDYMKSLIAIGLAPKRELEPQAARPHAFGNPFKLDKKNMSVVDEVGEVNASAAGTSSCNGGQQPEAGGNATGDRKERKVRGERAVSEGPGGNTKLVRPKRRPGPLDSNRLHTWKLKRRRLSCPFGGSDLGDLASNSGDMGEEVQSAPDMLDLGELRLELDEDEEMEPEEEEQQPTMTAMPSTSYQSTATAQEQQEEEEVDEIQIMGHFRAQPANNHFASSMAEEEQPPPADVPSILAQSGSRDYGLGQNEQNHVEFSPSSPVVVGNGHHQHSVDAAGIVGANAVAPFCQPSTSEPSPSFDLVANRPRRDRSQQQQQILPTISQREFLRKQREVRQLVRRIEPSAESLYRQVMEVVSDRNLSREKRHQLLELGHREAKLFKRQKLAEQLTRELQNNSGANNSILRPADQQRQNRQLHLLVNHNGFSNSSG